MKKVSNIKNSRKGFSLIEIVLIMFIISFSFVGVYRILARVSNGEKDSRYNLIAANLAQEGIEIIRNKRDNGFLAGSDLNSAIPDISDCVPYLDSSNEPQCDSSRSKVIGLDNNGVYENCPLGGCDSSLEASIFERECSISGDNDLKDISCVVRWKSPTLGVDKEILLENTLTDWQKN
jgi:type II secretory pathway pseudopilin PulG